MRIRRRLILEQSRRVSAVALAGAVLGPVAVACGPAQGQPPSGTPGAAAGQPVKGGVFTVGTFSDAATLQPILSQDTASNAYAGLHYNAPLLRYDPDTIDLEPKYGTAETFQQSADGLSLTFKLKPNLQWSDGKPLTAADYKFTWDKMLDPQVDYAYRSNLRYFEWLTAPDERTLVFKLKESFCPALAYTTFEPLPRHIFQNVDINDNPFNQRPTVGSGPWLLQEWVKDSHAVFTANEKFYLGRPNLDRWIYRVVKDSTVSYSMLKAGEVDQSDIQAIDWEEAKRLPNVQPISYYPSTPAGSSSATTCATSCSRTSASARRWPTPWTARSSSTPSASATPSRSTPFTRRLRGPTRTTSRSTTTTWPRPSSSSTRPVGGRLRTTPTGRGSRTASR